MKPERWARIKLICYEAAEKPADERAAFIRSRCNGDESLAMEIEALLVVQDEAGDLFEGLASSPTTEERDVQLPAPLKISHYQITGTLGRGGMGVVYKAVDQKLRRTVAIKSLPPESVGEERLRKRLLSEARAASRLNHPNICTIYEVDEADGILFIAMEYVEGHALSKEIHHSPIDIERAIDIGIQVAEGLEKAHREDIVHCDIKPSNIALSKDGLVKILDFGIARILKVDSLSISEPITEPTSVTEAGKIVGTVAYMSPEQLRGEPADPRSDLFSLGVVLYECCTGRRPFSGVNPLDVFANVIQSNPRPPSQLNPGVPAQLDAVTMKALARNAEDRYQSATEMLADLRKVREALQPASEVRTQTLPPTPVSSQTSVLTRVSTVLRKRTLITVGLIILLLVAGFAILLPPLFRPARPHQPLPEAMGWYEKGSAALRDGAYYQASKMLEKSVELDNKFALAHARLAEAYTEIDYTDKAKDEVLLASSLVPDRSVLSHEDASHLSAITATVMRDFKTAIERYREISERATDQEKPSVYLDLGRSYEKNEELEKALESYLEATNLDQQSGAAFLRLGIIYARKQNLQNAIAAFDRAETIYQTSTNVEGIAEVRYQRGALLNTMGSLSEAQTQLQRALEVTQTSANGYQQIRIRTLLKLSNISYNGGETAQAQRFATEAIELAQANGIESLATDGLIDLGNTFLFRGEFDQAEKYLRQALDFARRGKAHRTEARAILQLGSLNVQRDNPDEAIPYIERALSFYEPGGYNKETSRALILRGRAHALKGEYEAALQIFERQLQLANDLGDQSQIAALHQNMGVLLVEYQERYPEALTHFEESCRISEKTGNKSSLGYDLMNRGSLLWQLGRYDEAGQVLHRVLSIADTHDADNKELLALAYLSQAQMALSKRRFAEARTKSQQALESATNQFKETEIRANSTLGLVRALSGTPRDGRLLCERAVTMAREAGNPKLLSDALLSLAEALAESRDPQNAMKVALEAQGRFALSAQLESEWRAWLIAARASQLAANESAMRDYASHAVNVLSNLQRKWGAEPYLTYSTRPDVQIYRRQIDQMLAINR